MATFARRLLDPFQEFSYNVRVLRAPLLFAFLSLLLLSTPGQILELYLILARDWSRLVLQVMFAMLSLAALSFLIAHASRALTGADEDAGVAGSQSTAQGAITRTMPVVLGLLPLFGCAIGLYRALLSTSTEVLRRTVETITAFKTPEKVMEAVRMLEGEVGGKGAFDAGIVPKLDQVLSALVPQAILDLPLRTAELSVAIYTGMVICAALAALLVLGMMLPGRPRLQGAWRAGVFHPVTTYSTLVIFVAVSGLFAAQYLNTGRAAGYDFTSVPRALGTLALVNLSLLFLIFFCILLTRWSDRHRIPLLSPLIAFAFVFSLFNWNDNHGIRLARSSPDSLAKRKLAGNDRVPPSLFDAFDAWLASRPAEYKKKFEGKPYPIYVVAAQGGGMYAANLSGLFLARLYDRCPAIRHHLFAVSGVSGGSVGAGYFAALLNDPAMAPQADTCGLEAPRGGKGPIERKMEELLQTDFLSPVAASFLFPDLLQRFVPYPITAFDRARAFEAGVEKAWDGVMKSPTNPLRGAFWRHWRADGAAPMLLLNVTIVETGHQVAVAPVELDPDSAGFKTLGLESLQEILGFRSDVDVPLSTAMSLSARFPLVMPAGLLRLGHRDVRLVDGGYFENSGAEAAIALIQRLGRRLCSGSGSGAVDYSNCETTLGGEKRVSAFRIIVLTDYDEQADVLRDRPPTGDGLNEVLSPVRTMFNSRVARGELVVGRMYNFRPNLMLPPNTIPTVLISLNQRLYHLPLGWQLSAQVQSIISAQIGDPANCGYGEDAPALSEAKSIIVGIERGLRLVAEEKTKSKREVDLPLFQRTPFQHMLSKLQGNQCGVFAVLGSDGVAPRKSHCAPQYEVRVQFKMDPPLDLSSLSKLDEVTASRTAELRKRWVVEVEQKYGKAWANIERAAEKGSGCMASPSGVDIACQFSATPCDQSYYKLTVE